MTGLLASLFGLALLDCVNPSALAVTLYLLAQRSGALKVTVYMAAVFFSYLAAGVALMLGLGSLWGYLDGPVVYGLQGVIGAALLAYAILAPDKPREEAGPRKPRATGLGAVFLLGVTITAVEFSTAFPYLGAVAILTKADLPAGQWLPILVAYNLVFALPPFLLLGAYRLYGSRLGPFLDRLGARFRGGSRTALLWATGIVGFLLVADSLRFFDSFGLVEIAGAWG